MKKTFVLLLFLSLLGKLSAQGSVIWVHERVNGYNETIARTYLDRVKTLNRIEGIWTTERGLRVAITRYIDPEFPNDEKFKIIVLKSSFFSPWKRGDIRGYLESTGFQNVFSMESYEPVKGWMRKYNREFAQQGYYTLDREGKITEGNTFSTFNVYDRNKTIIDYFMKVYPNADNVKGTSIGEEADRIREKEIEKEKEKASKIIIKQKGMGSGFALHHSGYIATCAHVTKGADTIMVRGIDPNNDIAYLAKIMVEDPINDIAIIKVIDPRFTTLGEIKTPLAVNHVRVGEACFVIGFPAPSILGYEIKMNSGTINSLKGINDNINNFQISAQTTGGNSGGPVFNYKGEIIGVLASGARDINFANYAIKISYLQHLIDLLPEKLKMPQGVNLKKMELADLVDIAKKTTYQIFINIDYKNNYKKLEDFKKYSIL